VARGESLYTIAQKYRVTVQSIVDANQLSNPNRIDIGQRLVIPTGN
jgi:spore germination protein